LATNFTEQKKKRKMPESNNNIKRVQNALKTIKNANRAVQKLNKEAKSTHT